MVCLRWLPPRRMHMRSCRGAARPALPASSCAGCLPHPHAATHYYACSASGLQSYLEKVRSK